MVISGICATPQHAIDGFILCGGAVDVSQRVPLLSNHRGGEIGRVLHLQYINDILHCTVETDDAAACKLNFFSPGGRAIEHSAGRITRFRLHEISLCTEACNPDCKVTERRAVDPLHELHKTRAREFDLFIAAFQTLANGLQTIARAP